MKFLFSLLSVVLSFTIFSQSLSPTEFPSGSENIPRVPLRSFSQQVKSGAAAKGQASACGNLDFEDKNFGGWSIFTGSNAASFNPPINVVVDSFPSINGQHTNASAAFHAIVDSANSYFFGGGFVNIHSIYSDKNIARINHMQNGAKVGIMERQIPVTSNNAYLHFAYFVVFENGGHSQNDQPYFNFAVFDSSNTVVPGTTLNIVAGSNTATPNPGFVSTLNGFMLYKPWTPVTIDLTAYIGQTVTIQFIAADCSQGGHNGHALVDFDCGGPTGAVPNVWPGDANYDLTVNYLDMFYVGAGFGLNGSSRANPGNTWAAAASNNWNVYSLYLSNAKHADCDGDGVIGISDTTAIFSNYGQTHPFKNNSTYMVAAQKSVPGQVSVYSSNATLYADQPFTVYFDLGSLGNEIDSIYALGFKMTYPSHVLEKGNCWLDCSSSVVGTLGSNMLSGFKQLPGDADLVITKTDHLNTNNVAGNLFALQLKTKPLISSNEAFKFEITDLHAITKSGKRVELESNYTIVSFMASNAVSVAEIEKLNKTSVYPIPASAMLTISSTVKLDSYKIFSIQGQEVRAGDLLTDHITIADLQSGCYFLELQTPDGKKVSRRFIKD